MISNLLELYIHKLYNIKNQKDWIDPMFYPFVSLNYISFFCHLTVLFHICVLVIPLFLLSHIILWFESYGLLWANIPDGMADVMTLFVLFACIFFLIRRITVPEVRQVSQLSDFLVIGVIFISFLTGFLAFHQVGPYRPMLIAHIISGEILIVMIPFSRLFHMFVYPFSRYYLGEDFGKPLKANDW